MTVDESASEYYKKVDKWVKRPSFPLLMRARVLRVTRASKTYIREIDRKTADCVDCFICDSLSVSVQGIAQHFQLTAQICYFHFRFRDPARF